MIQEYATDILRCDSPQTEFSFCTMLTSAGQYQSMIESARAAGFLPGDCEFLYLDNSAGNRFDGYSALRRFQLVARGRYLVYCHQDVRFEFDGRGQLEQRLADLENLDPRWALAGNTGKTYAGDRRLRITDPVSQDATYGPLPALVMSLDENFIVLKRSSLVTTSATMSGFHLYGTDLVQNAQNLGYRAYVIDFHLRHMSGGNVDASYVRAHQMLVGVISGRKRGQFIQAMCSRFYAGSNPVLRWLCNRGWLLRLHRSLKRKWRPQSRW